MLQVDDAAHERADAAVARPVEDSERESTRGAAQSDGVAVMDGSG